VTAKLRSGFDDTSLFKENILAAQESGISYLTLHPRTKVEGYGPPANWNLIAEAKSLLKIPIVGNGDILNVTDALKMLELTKCDALMIGRGCVINPFIFHQIQAHFNGEPYAYQWSTLKRYFEVYLAEVPAEMSEKTKVNKMKQLMSFLFKGNEALLELRPQILRFTHPNVTAFLQETLPLLKQSFMLTSL
jgi:tRNA-dihydrouridine synthase